MYNNLRVNTRKIFVFTQKLIETTFSGYHSVFDGARVLS